MVILGAAAGISESCMTVGSVVNHIFKHGIFGWDNEVINRYITGVMQ